MIDLQDIRAFIKDIKIAFYSKESELDNVLRYALIKSVVHLRIIEQKLMEVIK
ncbi:hypothetical protein LCGC14_1704830 [marine sediment metagenome]|uniref:Uncharacterized protein n=1 Tax=marine sediment metagenome TaxID=412755 RepID=A0A0F9JXF9_9ZZZZ